MPRITARKYQGNDLASWAVFVDGKPAFTGLTRPEVPYYKDLVRKVTDKKEKAIVDYLLGGRRFGKTHAGVAWVLDHGPDAVLLVCNEGERQRILRTYPELKAEQIVAWNMKPLKGAAGKTFCVDNIDLFINHFMQGHGHVEAITGPAGRIAMLAADAVNDGRPAAPSRTPNPPSTYAEAVEVGLENVNLKHKLADSKTIAESYRLTAEHLKQQLKTVRSANLLLTERVDTLERAVLDLLHKEQQEVEGEGDE